MSYSGDAAEQVVRMSLEGVEVAAKITGSAAKQVALLLYSILKDQKRTKGKIRLTNLLRSGKELKVFAVQDKELVRFCKEAKKYGVLYCVLKDRDASDGITDVMVRAEDASKINRIFERFRLTTMDLASVRSEIERGREAPAESAEGPEAAPEAPARSREDVFLDALLSAPEDALDPTETPELRSDPFGLFSGRSEPDAPSTSISPGSDREERRPSVRAELKEIRAELEAKEKAPKPERRPLEHKAPAVKKKKTKKKER